jgi:hypothetical protein
MPLKHEGVEVQLHKSRRGHQMEVSGELHAPVALLPGGIAWGNHSTGG